MIKNLVLVIFLAFSINCFPSGPIISGGGNVNNLTMAYQGYIEFILNQEVGIHLNVALNSIYRDYINKTSGVEGELWDRFFKEKDKLVTLFSSPRIFVNRKEPCLDHYGNKSDASILAPEGYDICLSTASITGKLNGPEVTSQLVGLLAHEYSHLVAGTTESDANRIQWTFFWRAVGFGRLHVPLNNTRDIIRILKLRIEEANEEKFYENPIAICKIYTDAVQMYVDPLFPWINLPQILSEQGRAYLHNLRKKILNMQFQACFEAKGFGWEKMEEKLQQMFEKKDQVQISFKNPIFDLKIEPVYPWIRRVRIGVVPENENGHRYKQFRRIEQQEIMALLGLLEAQMESLYWLRIEVDSFPAPADVYK